MTREFGEGERNERSEDQTDELGELIDRIRARYEQTGKERDEDHPRVSEDDDPQSWPHEKGSALPEKSAEGLGKRSAEGRAGRPDEEREIEEGPERTGDARQEQNEPEFGSFVEHLKTRYGPDGGGEPERAPAPERERAQGELDVDAYERGENDERLEQQSATSETKREGVSGPPERADDSAEAADPARVGESPSGRVRVSQAGAEERARETETVAGRVETPRPREGAALKTDEESSRPEGGVAGNAEPRQEYLERSAAPASRLDEPEVIAERKEAPEVEPAEGLSVFSATALRRTDDSTAFEVRLDSLQKAGVTFETDKTYEIKGRIGEVCDFRKMYSPGESDRMAILAPKEYARSITPGEKYDVRIAAVKEISRNEEHLGVFSATAYRIPGKEDLMRFDLLVSSFEKRTGVRFEEGKMYEVRGRIGDVCDFKVTRTAERSQHLFVFAPREHARDLTPGRKYDLTVESVREKRECHVTDANGFPRLLVQKRALEAAGLKLDSAEKEGKIVAELNLKGSEGAMHRLFAKLEPSVSAVVMSMDKIGAKVGDVFDLERARKYTDGGFVEDFNKNRSRELSNVRLQLEEKKLNIFVDEKRFEISEYHLDAYRLQALLRCKVEPFQREIRFWFDGREATAKFGGSWRIQSFSASEKGMSMTYEMGRGQVTTWTDSRALEERKLGIEEIREKIELLSTDNRTNDQTVVFKAESSLYSFVYGRFTDAINRSRGTYMRERGGISEDLCVAALPKAWWEEVMRYPRAGGEDNHGPDSLMRNKETGELFIFEFKWWDDVEKAAKNAAQQVEDYFFENPTYNGEKIEGACIGILDWNLKSNTGKLHVKRVC